MKNFHPLESKCRSEQVAEQMGRTERQIKRYKGISYRGNLRKHAENLVKMKIEKP